jgi:CheY-like chemotaxis protein
MSNRRRPSRRKLKPVLDLKGRITHWRCSKCRWSTPTRPEFTGLAPSGAVLEEFQRHSCQGHSKTILLVEDDDASRFVLREVLEGDRHSVLDASSGKAAILLCKEHQGPIHLVITDVVLRAPHCSEIVERIRELRPGVPLLFMSGYAQEELNGAILDRGSFLQKPFTAEAVRSAVAKLLI